MDRPGGDREQAIKQQLTHVFLTFSPQKLSLLTFGASYSHDRLKADLPGEVTLQISLELLQLCGIVDEVEGRVVKDAAGRVPGDTG